MAPIAAANNAVPYASLVRNSEIQNQWHLTVANMVSWLTSDTDAASTSIAEEQYALRAQCVTAFAQVKCPIATTNANACGGQGNCTSVAGCAFPA